MLLKISPKFLTRIGRGIEERSAFSAEQVVCTGGLILSKAFNVSRQFPNFVSYHSVLFLCLSNYLEGGLSVSSSS